MAHYYTVHPKITVAGNTLTFMFFGRTLGPYFQNAI